MSLINALLTALNSAHIYIELKSDLNGQLFDERVAEALELVEQGIKELNILDKSTNDESANEPRSARKSILMMTMNSSMFENVDFGDIYGNSAISNSFDDVPKSSSTTNESLSLGDVYSKTTGDDNLTFSDVYDKDAEFETNSIGDGNDSATIDDVKFTDLYGGAYAGNDTFDNFVPNVEFFESGNIFTELKPPQKRKGELFEKPHQQVQTDAIALLMEDLRSVAYNLIGSGDAMEVASNVKAVTVSPKRGTMV